MLEIAKLPKHVRKMNAGEMFKEYDPEKKEKEENDDSTKNSSCGTSSSASADSLTHAMEAVAEDVASQIKQAKKGIKVRSGEEKKLGQDRDLFLPYPQIPSSSRKRAVLGRSSKTPSVAHNSSSMPPPSTALRRSTR